MKSRTRHLIRQCWRRGSNLTSETGDPHDGPTHTSSFLREVVNEHLPARWNDRGSPTSLAPLRRLSLITDFTTSDSFLWGSLLVPLRYTDNEDLFRAAEDVFLTINPQMLRRMPKTEWRAICLCVQHYGAHTDPQDIQPCSTSVIQVNFY
jgi:hypothetical protein